MHYPGIELGQMKKMVKTLSQGNLSPERDLNLDLSNTKQECYPLDRYSQDTDVVT
jgi:hypothetical protein